MNYWIFQAVPERYDLRQKPSEGDNITWYATRYRARMEIGDVVFFWLGGSPDIRGVYGQGTLTSKPYLKKNWDDYGVDVDFERRLTPHISISEIKAEPRLSNMQILNMAVGSNFYISKEEAIALQELIPSPLRQPGLG